MTDPWSVQGTNEIISQINTVNGSKGFEDSFIQDKNFNLIEADSGESSAEVELQPLPDSKTYLQNLERKLKNLKKNSKLVDALSEKRDDCLRSMLQNDSSTTCNNETLLELETSLLNSDSTVQNLVRQIQPVQPITVGETVHIVKYDQLEEQSLESEPNEEQEENLPASR